MTIKWNIAKRSESLVASGSAVVENDLLMHPPREWFTLTPERAGLYPVQIEADGRVHGYCSGWGLTHIGFIGRSVPTPRSFANYSKFRTGTVLCDDGTKVATGRMTINTVHPKMKNAAYNEVSAFYDHTGSAIADVVPFEDQYGIFLAGSLRPSATPEQIRIARASDWSPDWRSIDNHLEMVAILGVNLSGFVVDGLVASGGLAQYGNVKFAMPGETYVEVDLASGKIQTLIGGTRSAVKESAESVAARLEVLEEYVRKQQLQDILKALDA